MTIWWANARRQGDIGVEVDDPPGLVPEAAPCDLYRSHCCHDQEPEADDRCEQVGIRRDEDPQLPQRTDFCKLCVAEGDQHYVDRNENDRPWSDEAVPSDEPFLADYPLDPRNPGNE